MGSSTNGREGALSMVTGSCGAATPRSNQIPYMYGLVKKKCYSVDNDAATTSAKKWATAATVELSLASDSHMGQSELLKSGRFLGGVILMRCPASSADYQPVPRLAISVSFCPKRMLRPVGVGASAMLSKISSAMQVAGAIRG